MESFQRSQVDTLVERLAEPAHHIIALFGPRQTGKTTIARQALGRIDLGKPLPRGRRARGPRIPRLAR